MLGQWQILDSWSGSGPSRIFVSAQKDADETIRQEILVAFCKEHTSINSTQPHHLVTFNTICNRLSTISALMPNSPVLTMYRGCCVVSATSSAVKVFLTPKESVRRQISPRSLLCTMSSNDASPCLCAWTSWWMSLRRSFCMTSFWSLFHSTQLLSGFLPWIDSNFWLKKLAY